MIRATGEKAPLRLIAIHLTPVMNAIGALHGASGWLLEQMAEAAIGSLYLASTLKHPGAISTLFRWKGALSLIETDATPTGLLRQRVLQNELLTIGAKKPALQQKELETRRFDEHGKLLRRSIVEMGEGSIARNISWYLLQSDQVKSAVGIEAKCNPDNPSELLYAAGWFIEAFPDCDEATLAIAEQVALDVPPLSTLMTGEGFDTKRMLDQIAGPFPYVVHREIVPGPYCPCNRERMRENIGKLGAKTVRQLRKEQGNIETVCEFCRTSYPFDATELDQIAQELKAGAKQ